MYVKHLNIRPQSYRGVSGFSVIQCFTWLTCLPNFLELASTEPIPPGSRICENPFRTMGVLLEVPGLMEGSFHTLACLRVYFCLSCWLTLFVIRSTRLIHILLPLSRFKINDSCTWDLVAEESNQKCIETIIFFMLDRTTEREQRGVECKTRVNIIRLCKVYV